MSARAACSVFAKKTGSTIEFLGEPFELPKAEKIAWKADYETGKDSFYLTNVTSGAVITLTESGARSGETDLPAGKYEIRIRDDGMGGSYTVTYLRDTNIKITPDLTTFSEIERNKVSDMKTVTIEAPFPCPFTVGGVTTTDSRFELSSVPFMVTAKGTFDVRFRATLKTGETAGTPITGDIVVTGSTNAGDLEAKEKVSATIKPVASSKTTPAPLFFGDIIEGESKTLTLTSQATGTEDITVTLTSDNPSVTIEAPTTRMIKRDKFEKFLVTLKAPAMPGPFTSKITIDRSSRLGSLPDETIDVVANILKAAPKILCEASTFAGPVPDNEAVCFQYIIRNTGTRPLTLKPPAFDVATTTPIGGSIIPLFALKDLELIRTKGGATCSSAPCATPNCQNESPVPVGGTRAVELIFLAPFGVAGTFDGKLFIRSDELPETTCALNGSSFVVPPGQSKVWRLRDVTFSDGATATGYFRYDSTSGAVPRFEIDVSAGVLPARHYAWNDGSKIIDGPDPGDTGPFIFQAVSDPPTQLRIEPVSALPAGGNSNIALSLTGEHRECVMPCGPSLPFRTIVSGSVENATATIPTVSPTAMLLLGLALAAAAWLMIGRLQG